MVLLAILSLLFMVMFRRKARTTISYPKPMVVEEIDVDEFSEEEDLFESLDFQNVHKTFQNSYLELVRAIESKESMKDSPDGTIRIDIKKDSKLFETYRKAQSNYNKVLKRVEEHERDYKLKCFARMRKLILAVLYADKKLKKKVTKFDVEKLTEIGAIAPSDVPTCPRGGEYSIVYKNGRRLFNCSIHGVLKN